MFPKRFVFYKNHSRDKIPFAWKFYLIEYKDIKILVDTGFQEPAMVKYFNIQNYVNPVELLARHNVKPEDITDVIITHSHFDHIGSVYRFPSSNIYIQADELKSVLKGRGQQKVKKFLKSSNRIIPFKKSMKLYDLIEVKRIGGHTKGSSVVFLKKDKYNICFIGDEVYLEKNITDGVGNGTVYSHKNNMRFISELRKGNFKQLIFHQPDFKNFDSNITEILP